MAVPAFQEPRVENSNAEVIPPNRPPRQLREKESEAGWSLVPFGFGNRSLTRVSTERHEHENQTDPRISGNDGRRVQKGAGSFEDKI
jgi:hypothetical protein